MSRSVMWALRIGNALFVASCVLFFVAFNGCASFKSAESEATYLGQQLQCVDRFKDKAQIDKCRHGVREAWGIEDFATKDAGGQ